MATIRFLDQQNNAFSEKYRKLLDKNWVSERFSCHITEPEINRLCVEMLIWGRETESVRATTFLADFEIKVSSFHEWMEKYPELREAYRLLKIIFAEKREYGALMGKYQYPALVLATLPTYDEEYATYRKELVLAKAKEGGTGNTVVNVSMAKMPETDAVPQKCLGGTEIDDD